MDVRVISGVQNIALFVAPFGGNVRNDFFFSAFAAVIHRQTEAARFGDGEIFFNNTCAAAAVRMDQGAGVVFSSVGGEFSDLSFADPADDRLPAADKFTLLRHDHDMQFVHGKAYKRSFLLEKEIRFNDELLIHEDGFINTLVGNEAETYEDIENPFYVWRWRDDSIVRKDKGDIFLMKTYGDLLKTRDAVCDELQQRGFINEYFDAVAKTMIDAYYEFQKPVYLDPENAREVKRAERKVKKFYEKYKKDYNECGIDRITEIMHLSRENAYRRGMRIEQVSLHEWVNHIAKEVK